MKGMTNKSQIISRSFPVFRNFVFSRRLWMNKDLLESIDGFSLPYWRWNLLCRLAKCLNEWG